MIYKSFAFYFLLIVFESFNSFDVQCQVKDSSSIEVYDNSIEVSPMSPLMRIYAIQYSHKLASTSELMLGLAYMNIHLDMGTTNAPAIILGYRQYLLDKFHLEYQIWPTYDNFYEKNENKYYKSFDIWNEFRLGYQIDFELLNAPLFVSAQWPFGFALYAGNKPESFIEHEKQADNRFFYKAVLVFLGIRF